MIWSLGGLKRRGKKLLRSMIVPTKLRMEQRTFQNCMQIKISQNHSWSWARVVLVKLHLSMNLNMTSHTTLNTFYVSLTDHTFSKMKLSGLTTSDLWVIKTNDSSQQETKPEKNLLGCSITRQKSQEYQVPGNQWEVAKVFKEHFTQALNSIQFLTPKNKRR